MTIIELDAQRRERPSPTDQALAQRIAERIWRGGIPRPWSNGQLAGERRAAAERFMEAVQQLFDEAQAAEERAYRADTLLAALEAEQSAWSAKGRGTDAVAAAVTDLRRVGVAVALTSRGSRPRRGGTAIGLEW